MREDDSIHRLEALYHLADNIKYLYGAKFDEKTNSFYRWVDKDGDGQNETKEIIAIYDPEKHEYYIPYDKDGDGQIDKRIKVDSAALDCSGFTKKVYETLGITLKDGAKNQRDQLEAWGLQQDKAVVGGMIYINPPNGSNVPHVAIVTRVDDKGNPTWIIDSSAAAGGVTERPVPESWFERGMEYFSVPDFQAWEYNSGYGGNNVTPAGGAYGDYNVVVWNPYGGSPYSGGNVGSDGEIKFVEYPVYGLDGDVIAYVYGPYGSNYTSP